MSHLLLTRCQRLLAGSIALFLCLQGVTPHAFAQAIEINPVDVPDAAVMDDEEGEGDFAFDFEPPDDGSEALAAEPPATKDEPHTLYFGDGTSLRGRLLGIDAEKDVISWSRP